VLIFCSKSALACSGGTNAGTITPTAGYQTQAVTNGEYYVVNVTCGSIYNFTFCSNGGSASWDTQITVNQTNNTTQLAYNDDNCWTLNGDAQYITVNGEQCIELTDELNNQTGCAWSGSQIDFNQDFFLTLDYYFGNNINGADGNTFTFQPSASTACGTAGGQLGAGGITNALAIEFDTYDNDFPTHIYDMLCDHVAIETDGNHQNGTPAAGPACAKSGGGNIDDGGLYEVEITWNATTQTLDVYFDGAWVLNYTDDIVNNVFGGQNLVYWGATSATGGLNNQQYFCPSTVVLLPVEISLFESSCNGTSENFKWVTQTEQNTDHFVLEYTYDGFVFYPELVVAANGNSEEEITYNVRVETTDAAQRYYRLKVVDLDGAIQTSDLIASRSCSSSEQLIQSISQLDRRLIVMNKQKSAIKLIDLSGKIVASTQHNELIWRVDSNSLTQGIYHIIAVSETGSIASQKILKQ